MKTYLVKECFLTLQGEGERAGTKAVFVRFGGCNLWSGHEKDRDRDAVSKARCAAWCDTDFVGGDRLTASQLAERMAKELGDHASYAPKWCVFTGGEPGLQVDHQLVDTLHEEQWHIAVETNGTVDSHAIRRCDHICLSPKKGSDWRSLGKAHEIKVVLPGAVALFEGWTEAELQEMEELGIASGASLYVQPQDPFAHARVDERSLVWNQNAKLCADWVVAHPFWALSTQQHKFWGLR